MNATDVLPKAATNEEYDDRRAILITFLKARKEATLPTFNEVTLPELNEASDAELDEATLPDPNEATFPNPNEATLPNPNEATFPDDFTFLNLSEANFLDGFAFPIEAIVMETKPNEASYPEPNEASDAEFDDEMTSSCILYTNIIEGQMLECDDFNSTAFSFVPAYTNVTTLKINGTFSELRIDSRYDRLSTLVFVQNRMRSFKFALYNGFEQLSVYTLSLSTEKSHIEHLDCRGVAGQLKVTSINAENNHVMTVSGNFLVFPALKELNLRNNLLTRFDFADLPGGLAILRLDLNAIGELRGCGSLRALQQLGMLHVSGNDLAFFDLACVPDAIEWLNIAQNRLNKSDLSQRDLLRFTDLKDYEISGNGLAAFDFQRLPAKLQTLFISDNKLTEVNACDHLRYNLTIMFWFSASSNRLEYFDFECMPDSIMYVELQNNLIHTLNLRTLPRTPFPHLFIVTDNLLRCDCAFFVSYTDNHLASTDMHMNFDCHKDTSPLAYYPWMATAEELIAFDNSSEQCLLIKPVEPLPLIDQPYLMNGGSSSKSITAAVAAFSFLFSVICSFF